MLTPGTPAGLRLRRPSTSTRPGPAVRNVVEPSALPQVIRRCASIGAIVGMACVGCATYRAEPIDAARTRTSFEQRRLDAPELIAFAREALPPEHAFPPKVWTADDLWIASAFFQPEMRVALARVDEASAGRTTAAARPNPTFEFAPEYVSNAGPGAEDWVFGFKLDWPIETGNKRGARMRIAAAREQAARGEFADTMWSVRARVHAAWLACAAIHRSIEALEAERDARGDVVDALRKRFDAGDAARPEVSTAELELQRIDRDVRALRGRGAELRARLANALSVPLNALDGVELDATDVDALPEPPDASTARDWGLAHRADVARALMSHAIAEAELELEIAKQRPDVHLGPGFAWDQGDHKYALGVSLPLPLLDDNRGPIAESEARRRTSAAQFELVQDEAMGAIETARVRYVEALAQLEAAREIVERTSQDLQRAERALTSGESDRSTVAEAHALRAAARRDESDARLAARERRLDLEDALHVPLVGSDRPRLAPTNSETP